VTSLRRLAVVLLVAASACSIGQGHVANQLSPEPSPKPSTTQPQTLPSESPGGRDPLCPPQPKPTGTPGKVTPLPPSLAEVASQVEELRGLNFTRPVGAEAVSKAKMERLIAASIGQSFPPDQIRREGRALEGMGAIPPGTDLLEALKEYSSGQSIGYYDNQTKDLVFVGTANPTPFQRFTLAHELTHALDDQHFGLSRIDALNAACEGDQAAAFLALAEGDATETQYRWSSATLSQAEFQQLQNEANSYPPPPEDVPPFLEQELAFPYLDGQKFVAALIDRGGQAEVDAAFRRPPTSTEQILHPDKYPSDAPQAIEVPDIGSRLGSGWTGLDREDVGEEDLRVMLGLRLSTSVAQEAAAGWDGGQYLAWAKGSNETAVMLETVWDSPAEADQFTNAMLEWSQGQPVKVEHAGTSVTVLFGSDQPSLSALEAAAG
jgi:hypothetical protein